MKGSFDLLDYVPIYRVFLKLVDGFDINQRVSD